MKVKVNSLWGTTNMRKDKVRILTHVVEIELTICLSEDYLAFLNPGNHNQRKRLTGSFVYNDAGNSQPTIGSLLPHHR
jgi:hypothetical protein